MPAILAVSLPIAWSLVESIRGLGPGIVVLSILVVFHEFGHYLVAKSLKVPVHRFSVGFGPRLFGVKIGETDYCVSLLPLGGYVSMASEEKGPDGQVTAVDHFTVQTWWKRAVIAAAGPGANLVAGYILMVVVGLVGITYPDYDSKIGNVAPATLAAQRGFASDQTIASVNDKPVATWREFIEAATDAKDVVQVRVRDTSGSEHTIAVPVAERDTVLGSLAPYIEPVIGEVSAGLPAFPAGLREGDRVLAVNGKPVRLWDELTEGVHNSPLVPVTLKVERDHHTFDVTIKPTAQIMGGQTIGIIGISPPHPRSYREGTGFVASVRQAFPLTQRLVEQTLKGLWTLFSRPMQAKDQMGGPLLIMRMSSQQAQRGFSDFLFFMGVISIAIMAFNLLPLPVLDGGHLVLALLEGARRKPLAQGFLTAYQRLGLALIGSLLVFILFNDVWRETERRRAVARERGQAPADSVTR